MMYLEQEKPYRPLLTALIFAALPLSLLIHDVFAMIAGGGGLLFGRQGDGLWRKDGTIRRCGWLQAYFSFSIC